MEILDKLDQMEDELITIENRIREIVMDKRIQRDGLLCVEMAQEEVCRLRTWCKNYLK